ncbi:MAG: serine/threonine-protein kinase [Candidatus Omnitrophota bacterium]
MKKDLDSILLEILNEFIEGKKVDIEAYCKEYPQYKDAILAKFRTANFIKKNFQEVDLSGKKLGEYIILQELGRGGMGIVFLGIHPALSRLSAIKILPPSFIHDKETLKNFQEEAKTIAKFNHPNIVPIYSISDEKGVYYIAMGYISGLSLKDIIEKLQVNKNPHQIKATVIRDMLQGIPIEKQDITQKSITLKRGFKFWDQSYFQFVATIGSEIADALSYSHQNGIFHGDLKPSNILITNEGIPVIVDFGLSKNIKKIASSKSTEFTGTLVYAAPEQIRDNTLNEKTDIWSLGVTLYELLTFKNPFREKTVKKIVDKILKSNPDPLRNYNKKVPIELEAIVLKCLEHKPENRYSSIAEVSQDLKNYLNSDPIKAKPIGFIGKTYKRIRKHPVLTSLISIIFISFFVSSALTYFYKLNRFLAQGEKLHHMIKPEDAKKIYEKVLKLTAGVPLTQHIRERAFYGLAQAAWSQKDKSLEYYNECSKINPKNIPCLMGKCLQLEELGKYNEAFECRMSILAIDPYDVLTIKSIAEMLAKQGKMYKALEFLAEKCKLEELAEDGLIKFEVSQIVDAMIYTLALTYELSNGEGYSEAKRVLISKGFDEKYADSIIDKFKGLHPYFSFKSYYEFKKSYDNNELTNDDLKRFKWIINDLKARNLL